MTNDGWPPAVLKEHFDELLKSLETRLNEHVINLQRQIQSLEERQTWLESLAEGRLTRPEYHAAHKQLEQAVENLRQWVDQQRGRGMGTAATRATVISIVAVLIAFAHTIIALIRG